MLLARFLRNRKGGVAPMLALAHIPLIGAVGAAVDYSRANSTRTAMQAALDSTALMLSKDAQTLSSAQLGRRRPPISTPCSSAPKPRTSRSRSSSASPAAGQLHPQG